MITQVCCYNGSWVEMRVPSDSSELIQVLAKVLEGNEALG